MRCAGVADRMVKDAGRTLRPVLVAPDVTADERGLTRLKQVPVRSAHCNLLLDPCTTGPRHV